MHRRQKTIFYCFIRRLIVRGKRRRNFRSSAFTLIEMLVVVAIIAILAAMLTPALMNAVDTAKSVKCASAQRQIGIGFVQYTGDYDDFTPINGWCDRSNNWANSYAWQNLLGPYCGYETKGWQGMLPSNEEIAAAGGVITGCAKYSPKDGESLIKPGYGMTCYPLQHGNVSSSDITIRSDHTGVYRFVRLNEVTYAGRRAILADADSNHIKASSSYISNGNFGFYLGSGRYRMADVLRHGESMNALFYDGHVQSCGYLNAYLTVWNPALYN